MSEARELADHISATLTRCFETVTIFEHGAACSGSAMGCGVDHAHLHLVPLQVDLVSEALADRSIHWEAIPHWSELHQRVPEDRDYLLVSNVDSIAYVANTAPPTSQYFRKLVAKLHGMKSRWDYQTYPFAENAKSTVESFFPDNYVSEFQASNDKPEMTGEHCS